MFILCYFAFLHVNHLHASMFYSLFIRPTLKKTKLFFTKINFYVHCGFKEHVLCVANERFVLACVANEIFVLATLLVQISEETFSTEETFSPAFVIRILLTSPKKQDHCFAPIKKKIAFPEYFFVVHYFTFPFLPVRFKHFK